jgi:DNA-binding transcriptional LysR family regulator
MQPLIDRVAHRLKLRDLRLLDSVVRTKSMARAAAELNLTQPAVSKAVSELEHVLGVRLLERSRQGIEPTPHGRALLRRGIAIFDELRQGVSEIEFLSDPQAGEVRIAASETITAGLLPIIIDRLSRRYPRMSIYIMQTPIASLDQHRLQYSALRDRNVDLVLGPIVEPRGPDLQVEHLFDDLNTVVAGTRSPWVRRRKIELASLLDEPWCLPPADTIAGAHCRQIFYVNGLEPPRRTMAAISVQMQIGMLATQRFLTMLPRSLLRFAGDRHSIKSLR